MRKSLAEVWQRLTAPPEAVAAWCARWRIVKFGVYGSVMYRQFGPDSDVNVLVNFARGAEPSEAERALLAAEAAALFGRPTTIADAARLESEVSTFRRVSILGTAQTLYERRLAPEAPETEEMEVIPEDFVLYDEAMLNPESCKSPV